MHVGGLRSDGAAGRSGRRRRARETDVDVPDSPRSDERHGVAVGELEVSWSSARLERLDAVLVELAVAHGGVAIALADDAVRFGLGEEAVHGDVEPTLELRPAPVVGGWVVEIVERGDKLVDGLRGDIDAPERRDDGGG